MSELDQRINDWERQLAYSMLAVAVASNALDRLVRQKAEETQLTLEIAE